MNNEERDKAISDIKEMVTDIHGKYLVIDDHVKEHRRTLYGNGRPGLVERHNAVEIGQRKCPALQAKLSEDETAEEANFIAKHSNFIQLATLLAALAAIVVSVLS